MTQDAIFLRMDVDFGDSWNHVNERRAISSDDYTSTFSAKAVGDFGAIIDYSIGRIDVNVSGGAVDVRYGYIDLSRIMLEDNPLDGLMPLSGALLLEGGRSKSIPIIMTESQSV